MKLKEMAQKLRELRPIAEMDLTGVPYNERHGAEGIKRKAAREIGEIGAQFSDTVKNSVLGLFVFGDPGNVSEFSRIAESNAGAFTLDARELYDVLAKETLRGTSRLELGINEIAALGQAIQSIAVQCGAVRLPVVSLGKLIHARFVDRKDAAKFIYENAVYPSLGDELNVLYLQKKLVNEVAKVDYESNTVPVIIVNATTAEASGQLAGVMFPNGNLSVDTEGSVDKDQVIRAFKKLKEVAKGIKARKVQLKKEE